MGSSVTFNCTSWYIIWLNEILSKILIKNSHYSHFKVIRFLLIYLNCTYWIVGHSIIIGIFVASISESVPICIFLAAVGSHWTVVLQKKEKNEDLKKLSTKKKKKMKKMLQNHLNYGEFSTSKKILRQSVPLTIRKSPLSRSFSRYRRTVTQTDVYWR